MYAKNAYLGDNASRQYEVVSYNLDVIITVGYRVKSFRGVEFRRWATNLLYLVTKNHGFSDGNKRIAAGLFLYFLSRNRLLLRKDGSKRVADHTLVALTVMIAESRPPEKEMMVNLVMHILCPDLL